MVTIPIYFTFHRKTKPSTTSLISLNWFRNAFFHAQNTVKRFMESEILPQLDSTTYSMYEVLYIYHYKSKTSDLGNVTAMASKWFNDALKEHGSITDDNVQYLKAEYHLVGQQAKDNWQDLKCQLSILLEQSIEYFRYTSDSE